MGRDIHLQLRHQRLSIFHAGEFAIVQRKSEGIAEGRERSLGRVSFGGFERELMRFSWSRGLGFAASAAFPGDGYRASPARQCALLRYRLRHSVGSPSSDQTQLVESVCRSQAS